MTNVNEVGFFEAVNDWPVNFNFPDWVISGLDKSIREKTDNYNFAIVNNSEINKFLSSIFDEDDTVYNANNNQYVFYFDNELQLWRVN